MSELLHSIISVDSNAILNRLPVSIGMPVYNGEKYIREALDSLLSQTFSDFELIISDNASTDNTQSICEEYVRRDSRISYFCMPKNEGALPNFQFVLNKAKGEFFMWAAADDIWDSNWIEFIYQRIRDEKFIAGFGELIHIDEKAKKLNHPANFIKFNLNKNWVWRKISFYLPYEALGKANLFYALYPCDILKKIKLTRYIVDFQILFSILDQVGYVQVKGSHLLKRIHNDNDGNTKDKISVNFSIWLAIMKVIRRDLNFAGYYLSFSGFWLKVVLIFLMPLKIFLAIKFHISRSISLLKSRAAIL